MGCLADLANPYAFKGEGRGLPEKDRRPEVAVVCGI